MFDSRTKAALAAALAKVEKKLGEQMQKELETLQQQNSAKLQALEDGLAKRITEQEKALQARSDYQFQLAQGLAAGADERYAAARDGFRWALEIDKPDKPQRLFDKRSGATCARNIFVVVKNQEQANFEDNARKELAD